MKSCRFFPDHSMKISNSQKPYDFRKILNSHFTPKGAPVCAKASKSYDWDVRKPHFLEFFSIFAKTLHTIRTKFS